jgi:hypothetical protein
MGPFAPRVPVRACDSDLPLANTVPSEVRSHPRCLGTISPKLPAALIARLEAIAEQPFAKHANVERIKGETEAFRLRQGDWRAKYRIDREAG